MPKFFFSEIFTLVMNVSEHELNKKIKKLTGRTKRKRFTHFILRKIHILQFAVKISICSVKRRFFVIAIRELKF